MKKLNLLLMACAVAFMGYAQILERDPAVFEPMGENGMFTFENKWLVSAMPPLENFGVIGEPNFLNPGYVRNVAVRNGIVYFADRQERQLIRMDAMTGERLTPVTFEGTDVFMHNGEVWGMPFQTLRVDCAGNLVSANLKLAGNRVQVWVIDTDNPANSHLVVDDLPTEIWNDAMGVDGDGNPLIPMPGIRIDFFGFYGDMLNNGVILGANSGSASLATNILRWDVVDGEATWCPFSGAINIDLTQAGMIGGLTTLGVAPTAQPISEDLFFLNFGSQPPLLMDMGEDNPGEVLSSLFSDFPNEDDELDMSLFRSPQGIMEFTLRGNVFLLVPYRTWNPGGVTFRLLRFEDEGRSFEEIHPMWEFPQIGFGPTGTWATGAMSVDVDEVAGTATIAIHANVNGGYGVYVLRVNDGVSVPGVYADALRVFVDGNVVRIDEPATEITVFSVTGQQVVTAVNTNTVTIPVSGVFLVRVDGQTQRVVIRFFDKERLKTIV